MQGCGLTKVVNVTAEASSSESDNLSADAAIDSDETTRWASGLPWVDDEWFALDLQHSTVVTSVSILWEGAFAAEYELQLSNDGATWATVATESGLTTAGWRTSALPAGSGGRWLRWGIWHLTIIL